MNFRFKTLWRLGIKKRRARGSEEEREEEVDVVGPAARAAPAPARAERVQGRRGGRQTDETSQGREQEESARRALRGGEVRTGDATRGGKG